MRVYIVTADADGQTDPDDLEVVLEPVVVGRGRLRQRLAAPRPRLTAPTRCATSECVVFAALISLLTGHGSPTPPTRSGRFRAELTAELILDEPQYQASELLIGAIMHGCRFEERPVTMRARRAGKSKKGGNLLYGLRYGRVVLRTWLRERRRAAQPVTT